jgi:uncharacterized protein (DUF2252 family)
MTLDIAVEHQTVAERRELGRDARTRAALADHAGWQPPADRGDPVALLEAQDRTREPDLVPVRHGRMMASPFTFYRGSAAIMAADLASTPTSGLDVQLCGDAHLSNFGAYASPERQLLFDVNDFDETLPGPFEYDVKRLAASFAIAAHNNKFRAADVDKVVRTVCKTYRTAMAEFAKMDTLDIWYARISENDMRAAIENLRRRGKAYGSRAKRSQNGHRATADISVARGEAELRKAHTRTNLQALAKLTEVVDGKQRIASQPPVLIPLRELGDRYGLDAQEMEDVVHHQFAEYRSTLEDARRRLLDRYTIIDVARKVVGVGSVGTQAFILLLEGRDDHDPLFLQVKQATRSVLEDYLPPSLFAAAGERVVQGQLIMQAASDIFLGWSQTVRNDRYFYWRQLRDMKGSAIVEIMVPEGMNLYADFCGWTLARAHARSGDPVAIAAYLGSKDRFEKAIAAFAEAYAAQNERDYNEFRDAISSGRLEATPGV